MVYVLLRALLRHALAIFFRRIEIEGKERVPEEGPLLLASNHPNTLIDVLLAAAFLERKVGFVAKAGLFTHPIVGPIIRFLGAVPVERRMDGPIDDAARAKNAQVLAACEERVASGGALLIFPEGTSLDEPRLQPFKTGAARIALGAEKRAPGRVQVVPVSLVYDAPGTFRSHARVRYGEPISAAAFARLDAPAPEGAKVEGQEFVAARALTQAIRDVMVDEVVHVEGEDAPLVRDLTELYGVAVAAEAGGRLAASAAISRAVRAFRASDPKRVEAVRTQIGEYKAALARAGVDDAVVRSPKQRVPTSLEDLGLWLASPLAVWGILNHVILYNLPRVVLRLTAPESVFAASVKLTVGFLGLFLVYAVQGGLVGWYLGPLAATLYLLSLPISGIAALLWLEGLLARREGRRARRARDRLDPATRADLEGRRATLLRELDRARVAYLAAALEAPAPGSTPPQAAPPVPAPPASA